MAALGTALAQPFGKRSRGAAAPPQIVVSIGTTLETDSALAVTSTGGGGGAFLPSSIAGLQGWWDSSDATTFSYSSGSVVSQWRDKSVNARHFAQGTVANQPGRTSTINSLDTILFDAVNDYLDTASFTVSQPLTVLYVIQLYGGFPQDFGFSSVGGNLQLDFQSATRAYYAGVGTVATGFSNDLNPHQWSWVMNDLLSKPYRDGVVGSTGDPGTSGTTTGFRIAERNLANYPHAKVAEIVVYDSALSTTDRQVVENYLKTKWGTPSILVSDSFNRANNVSSMGNAETGQAWNPLSGTWGIISNNAYVNGIDGSQNSTAVEASVADCSVQATFTVAGALDSGLVWRCTDINNFFLIGHATTHKAFKIVAGSYTQLADSGETLSNGSTIKITLSGNSHIITKNGGAWVSFSEAFNNTATKHGLRILHTTARFDDFSVTVP